MLLTESVAYVSVNVPPSETSESGLAAYDFVLPASSSVEVSIDEPSSVSSVAFSISEVNPDETPSVSVTVVVNPGEEDETAFTQVNINIACALFSYESFKMHGPNGHDQNHQNNMRVESVMMDRV